VDTRASDTQRQALRLRIARRQVPEILLWAGILTLVFGVVNLLTLPDEPVWNWIINVAFGPLFIGLSWAIHRGLISEAVIPWAWALCASVLVALLVNAFRLEPTPANLAYLAVVMTAFGPVTHAWPPFCTAAAIMLTASVVGFVAVDWPGGFADVLVCVTAVVISGFLLRLRLRAVDALADSHAELERQATVDAMTDTLNRAGLARSTPALAAAAERTGGRMLAWFIDVRGLKRANDSLGHPFGDSVIVAVGRALKASIRTNDLLARWGGDEFVVLGTGRDGSAEELDARVHEIISRDETVAHHWPVTVTVGFASGAPDGDVGRLISAADADMYRRRSVA